LWPGEVREIAVTPMPSQRRVQKAGTVRYTITTRLWSVRKIQNCSLGMGEIERSYAVP
jgi:hypothetical protein